MSAQTLEQLYDAAFAPRRMRGKSASTQRQYKIQLRHFARFLGRPATLDDLTDDTVSQFFGWLLDDGHAAPTVNKARNHVLSLWRFAARKGLVPVFPDVPALPEPEIVPQAWTMEQLARLFKACHETRGTIDGIPSGRYWWALHNLLWDTAERTWAAMSVRWEFIDLDRRWITIPAECRKGKRKALSTELHTITVAALREIAQPTRDLVFPWPWCRGYFYNHYTALLKRASLPHDRRCKPQKMRRSVASWLEAAGINSTPILRHTSRRVTEQSYIDPSIAKQTHAAHVLPRIAASRRPLPPPLAS